MKTVETSVDVQHGQVRDAITRLLVEQKAKTGERRASQRVPFFRPVNLAIEDGGQMREFSCFSRDVSLDGIGLLHNMPLESGSVLISIAGESRLTRIHGEIVWCKPCGEGWYLSGAEFVALAD